MNYMDNFLLLNLKTMFEHHVEDNVWKNQQGLVKVLNWKLYDSCGVHCVTMQSILFYLLVEKMYPLINHTLHQMFNDVKLQVDYKCEMAFELLRLVKKQLKEGYGRIVRIKSLLEVTAAKVRVTAAKQNTSDDLICHALWEVIENGYTAPKSTVVEGVEKFNSIKDAKLLLEAIKEGVYVCQPPGFEDPDFLDKVYKVEKALYGLHQTSRAWYKGDILLVQVYVDDIIFGSTKKDLCVEFEKLMHEKFQMSSTGELTFFLGLQVQQKKDDIFISQDKYVGEILKKFGFTEVKTTSTPMETQKPLLKDEDGEEVDVHMYRSMIGSLMYFTSSRPGSMYLKGQQKLGFWYPKDSPCDLVAYIDSDYAGASLYRKSTTGGCQFLGSILISWQCKK
ncbi:uncharacterized mitochondrial protein-like protein [Tanacetum coccineum]|uniref:Uncharacterized mitochondrial protein-like protein n=1 Tax=Tanacetum coccineum TaxID=301880 RepID=A0ABQ5FME7_9ASTR